MDDAGIEELLDELAERIEQSKPVLGNSQKRQVEIGPIFEILDEIRDIFPEELRQARIIVRDRQGMIEAAEIDANRILEDAERQAEHLAGEEEVVRIAEQRAQEVIDDAMAREREMRVGAEDYADQIFANLETKPRQPSQERHPLPPAPEQRHDRLMRVHCSAAR